MRAVKTDKFDRPVGLPRRRLDILAQRRHAEYTTAVGDDLTGCITLRTSVEHRNISQFRRGLQSRDAVAPLDLARICRRIVTL